MKSICKTFSDMGVIFRDESNEPSSIMIGYSDATITASNHPIKSLINYSTCYSTIIVKIIF